MEMLKTLKDKIMGTDEQNKAASERMKNNPMEKKFQKMTGSSIAEEATPGPTGFKMDMDSPMSRETQKRQHERNFKMDMDSPKSRETQKEQHMRGMKKGGVVKSSASKRADGCAIRGKTRA